jgi:hypothetical protein
MTTVHLKLLASENMGHALVLGHIALIYGMCIFSLHTVSVFVTQLITILFCIDL